MCVWMYVCTNESRHIRTSHVTHESHIFTTLWVSSVHAATHYNILQHTATHCNTLQHPATHTLQHVATFNSRAIAALCVSSVRSEHVATQHNALQHTATRDNTRITRSRCTLRVRTTRSVLQCVAVCCSVLQCVAVCCSVSSEHAAIHCNTLQHSATQ